MTYLDRDKGVFHEAKRLGECALCKAKDFVYDVGALGPHFRFCRKCVKKQGAENLRKDADVALERAASAKDATVAELKLVEKRYAERFGTGVTWKPQRAVAKDS